MLELASDGRAKHSSWGGTGFDEAGRDAKKRGVTTGTRRTTAPLNSVAVVDAIGHRPEDSCRGSIFLPALAGMACGSGEVTPKRPSISPVSRAWIPRV